MVFVKAVLHSRRVLEMHTLKRYFNKINRVNFAAIQNHLTSKPSPKLEPPWDVMFFGTDDFAVQSLSALCKMRECGLIGKLDVVTSGLKTSPVQKYCTKEKLDMFLWPLSIPEGVYDVGTVVSFGHLLPVAVINAFPMGILNVHGSLLPRWRGAAPVIHAVLNNDQMTGITIMEIQPHAFDVGRIVKTKTIQIPWDMKSKTLSKQLAVIGAKELISVMENLPSALKKASVQPSEGATKAPKVSKVTSRIKWDVHSCRDIQARFRALDDYFPLWTLWQDTPVKLRQMVMHTEWFFPDTTEETCEGSIMKQTQRCSDLVNQASQYYKDNINPTESNLVYTNEINNKQIIRNVPQKSSASLLASVKEDTESVALKKEISNGIGKASFGTVTYNSKSKTVSVRCADNWVSFKQVLVKGKKPMSAQEFYNGFVNQVPIEERKFS